MAAFLALWAWGGGGGAGVSDSGRISGVISWTQWDANGNVIGRQIIHNTTTTLLKDHLRTLLGTAGGPAGITGDADLYDNIQLLTADDADRETTPANGDLSANLDANPADGTNADGASGVYTTVVTFTASGASTIEELQLTKGAATSGTAETIGAFGLITDASASDSDAVNISEGA
jgi:hypothetical protein